MLTFGDFVTRHLPSTTLIQDEEDDYIYIYFFIERFCHSFGQGLSEN